VTVDSIEAGHAWLIRELIFGSTAQPTGFVEVIYAVHDRAVTYSAGPLSSALVELTAHAATPCLAGAFPVRWTRGWLAGLLRPGGTGSGFNPA